MPQFDAAFTNPATTCAFSTAAEEDEDVEGSRLPLLIVLALLVLAMFAGVVWLAYTQGVARGRAETPVLAAEPARHASRRKIPAAAEQPIRASRSTSSRRRRMTIRRSHAAPAQNPSAPPPAQNRR